MINDRGPVVTMRSVVKTFGHGDRVVRAVDGVDLEVWDGRSVGLAGESGSGKSTLTRLMLALEQPTKGQVHFAGRDLSNLSTEEKVRYRAAVQAVFQDPGSSFNPRKRIWRTLTEPAWVADGLGSDERRELAGRLLTRVELDPSKADRLPHQLSGGERQRVAIARALSSNPRVVVLDEPVTALDISIRGHILNLLIERAKADEVTYVAVSHDLTATYHLTDYLYIMYAGRIIEEGPTVDLIAEPLHPYTRLLVASIGEPLYRPERDADEPVPAGACSYVNRCAHAAERCAVAPVAVNVSASRKVSCHLYP